MTATYDVTRSWMRAWDRAEGRSIVVRLTPWMNAHNFSTVLVEDAGNPGVTWHARKADIDFRYFGEPPTADRAERRRWAKRLASDRRHFWANLTTDSEKRLARLLAYHDDDLRASGKAGQDTHFKRVARNRLARLGGQPGALRHVGRTGR